MQYTKEELNQLNIYSLRNFARETGVKSPTTLTKENLINSILEIQNGQKLPQARSKRGRPLKSNLVENVSLQKNKEATKKQLISSILKEIEQKLNEIL